MLVVDRPNRRVFSCPADRAAMPYVSERPDDMDAVERLLWGIERDAGFLSALARELGAAEPVPPPVDRYPERLVETACRSIARRQIAVAQTLPPAVLVVFDKPTAAVTDDAVQFADAAVARRFLADLARVPENLAALRGALAHDAGATPIRGLDARRPVAGGRRPVAGRPADPVRVLDDTAELLVNGDLALLPSAFAPGRLRLVWVERWDIRIAPPAPPPPDPAAAPSSPSPAAVAPPVPGDSGPLSQLPDLPDDLSPQALALQEAAQFGIPFCQECAKALEKALG